MRAIAFILLGLLIGAMATVSVLNALRPATAFPKGVMALLQHHLCAAREIAGGPQCSTGMAEHLEAIAVLARDIKPAFLPIGDQEASFVRYADDFRAAAEAARGARFADCKAATEALGTIGDGCKACHRDFK
jgi:hypothetical protein